MRAAAERGGGAARAPEAARLFFLLLALTSLARRLPPTRLAQRFYVGRPVSGLVWLFTVGLFGVGWVIDAFLIPEFVEEHNKKARVRAAPAALRGPRRRPLAFTVNARAVLYYFSLPQVFHQQMLETGTTLLFDGEYGASGVPYYPTAQAGPPGFANPAPYSSHVYFPQPQQQGRGAGGGYDGSYY